jgi:hypothetical protein
MMAAVAAARDARSAGLIPLDGPGFADAVAAARDRSAWPAGERAGLQRVVVRGAALGAIAGERLGDRPDRVEPQVVKRRPKAYPRMQEPRRIARWRLMRVA